MTLTDFRIGWRTLVQEPAYSLVTILGLGIGMASALLLLAFVHHSTQYNAHVPDVEHVYMVKQQFNVDPKAPWFDQGPLLLRAAAARTPGVRDASAFIPTRPKMLELTVRVDDTLSRMESLTVLPGFADTLGIVALQGDLKATLLQPEGLVVSEHAARKLFGSADVMGRTLQADGKLLRVGAIVATPPASTTIPFEALVGAGSVLGDASLGDEMLTGNQGTWGKILIRVHPGASLATITAALQQAIDAAPTLQKQPPEVRARLGARKVMEVRLAPLRDAYFDQEVAGNYVTDVGDRANPALIAALAAIALLILALAAFNYVNLAAVRVLRRQRELAMRKVMGASVRSIVLQLLAESTLVAMLSTLLGLVLAWSALPLFSTLVARDLSGMLSGGAIAAVLGLGLLLALLTAAYPAWIAVRVHPGQVLAGRSDSESLRGMQLRRVMTVLQVASAMGFASVTLAIAWQTRYAMQATPGFDAAPLLIVDLPEPVKESAVARSFVAALSADPSVAGVAISEEAVGRHNVSFFRNLSRTDGLSAPMELKSVSTNFFHQYRMQAVAGRLYDPGIDREDDPVPAVLNAIAARELGFANPADAVGQTLLYTDFENKVIARRVIGIAPEVRYQSLRVPPRAIAYELWTTAVTLSVRASGSSEQAESAILSLWPKYFPNAIVKLRSAKAILDANYADDARMARLLALATAIALAIASFGTYMLAASTVQRRAKEIVLRKLHGAGRGDIALLVVREIAVLTLVAAAIALPLAAAAIHRYLAGFVEHAPIGAWTMLLAFAATLAIAVIAVARHTWIAMRMQPAQALQA